MREFIEVSASGEWDDELNDYVFEDVDEITFFAIECIEWFQQKEDCVIFGVKGYDTAFKTDTAAFIKARSMDIIGCIIIPDKE